MNAAHLKRAADLHTMLASVKRATQYNRLSMYTTLAVAGTSPITLDAKVTDVILAAAKSHLTAELTRLGVTELETQ
jgi:enoyl reductase-like protein